MPSYFQSFDIPGGVFDLEIPTYYWSELSALLPVEGVRGSRLW